MLAASKADATLTLPAITLSTASGTSGRHKVTITLVNQCFNASHQLFVLALMWANFPCSPSKIPVRDSHRLPDSILHIAITDLAIVRRGKKWQDAGCVYGPKRTIAGWVLDAQYFGLAQRRRRVFVVASARDGFDPTEILFERQGNRRDSPPGRPAEFALHPTLTAQGRGSLDDREAYVLEPDGVRRTSVIEWERCQGFPDNYTQIPWRGKPASECPDGPRYKAIGNSKEVTVVRWIGRRLLLQL